jgi:hypothetical protein
VACKVEAGTGSAFLTCEMTMFERLDWLLSDFQAWAGTGSTFLTCEVTKFERFGFSCETFKLGRGQGPLS